MSQRVKMGRTLKNICRVKSEKDQTSIFLKVRCTPSQLDPRAIQTYITHSLHCLYGTCGGAKYIVDVLSTSSNGPCSEIILRVSAGEVEFVRAALTLPPCTPNALIPSGGYTMDVIGIERSLLDLNSNQILRCESLTRSKTTS